MWDTSERLACILYLNLLSCSNLVLYEQLWSLYNTAFLFMCGRTEIHVCSPCDPGVKVHWCLWGSLPTETGVRGLAPSLPILVFSSTSGGLAFTSSCRSKSPWQREGSTVRGNVSRVEFMWERNMPYGSPPSPQAALHASVYSEPGPHGTENWGCYNRKQLSQSVLVGLMPMSYCSDCCCRVGRATFSKSVVAARNALSSP